VTSRDLFPHRLWQTGICVHTVCDKQGSVWTQIPVCQNLCGHRPLFVTNCVDTDPCLSQIVGTQIPVCHNQQGSVSTQFVTNRDLCPHSLWQTGICVHIMCDKQGVWHNLCGHRSLLVTNYVDTDSCLSQTVWTQIPICHKLCGNRSLIPHSLWQTRICVHTICDKQGSVSTHTVCDKQGFFFTQVVTNRDLCPHNLSQTVWTQIPVCQKLWTKIPVWHNLCGHRSLLVTNGICVHTICSKQGSVSTQFVTKRDLCSHSLWQKGICVHIICDKQVCPHRLWTNCMDTDPCLSQTVWTQIHVCHKLCGHRSLFVTTCVDTDPCLSQIMWTQIPACHTLCEHRSLFVTNCVDTDPCLSQIVWTQIPVCHNLCENKSLFVTNYVCTGICFHTVCDKQGSVFTQFVTNRNLCPHNLWQAGVSTQVVTNRDLCPHNLWQTGICACHKLCGQRSLFVTNYVDTDPCLSQTVRTQIPL
jgi:hypothetical protein